MEKTTCEIADSVKAFNCQREEQCDDCFMVDHLKECSTCEYYDHPKNELEGDTEDSNSHPTEGI